MSYVYIVRSGNYYKIGKADDINSRLVQLQTGNPEKLVLISAIECPTATAALKLEAELHTKLGKYSLHHEWFDLPEEVVQQLYTVSTRREEPTTVKMYDDAPLLMRGLTTAARTVLYTLLVVADSNNICALNAAAKKRIAEETGMGIRTIDNRLQELVKSGIIDRVALGTFVLNPYLFGKGDWKTITALRNKNIHLEIVYDKLTGKRKLKGKVEE